MKRAGGRTDGQTDGQASLVIGWPFSLKKKKNPKKHNFKK
jgi:hypothetical protein